VDVSPATAIPVNTMSGKYWIGVILDIADHDTANNDSDGQDAAEITVVPPSSESVVLVFEDRFPSRNINRTNWWTVESATVDDVGIMEPSYPYSLRLNGKDEVWSKSLDLRSFSSAKLIYHYQRRGGGERPDSGDDLMFEYWNGSMWRYLDRQSGSGSDMTSYDQEDVYLPSGALRTGFRFRIRSTGDLPDSDDWFVDNVRILGTY
jgi:hypothetical protein